MDKKPHIIFTIGNPCSGKSTFAEIITRHHQYNKVDDLEPLQEIFRGDSILIDDGSELEEKINFWNQFKKTIKFTDNLWNDDIKKESCNLYSKPSDTGGYNILDPMVWDLILKFRAKNLDIDTDYIFEFSRGLDEKYLDLHNIPKEQVYKKSFETLLSNIQNQEADFLIINFSSNLEDRKLRNKIRYEEGGHFVSDKGMNEIYKEDIFYYTMSNDVSYLEVNGLRIPVVSIQVPDLTKETRDSFFLDIYHNSLKYFNQFNGDFNNG